MLNTFRANVIVVKTECIECLSKTVDDKEKDRHKMTLTLFWRSASARY